MSQVWSPLHVGSEGVFRNFESPRAIDTNNEEISLTILNIGQCPAGNGWANNPVSKKHPVQDERCTYARSLPDGNCHWIGREHFGKSSGRGCVVE